MKLIYYVGAILLLCGCAQATTSFTYVANQTNVQFTDTSSGIMQSILWNFGDGSTNISSTSPYHTYYLPRQYAVKLTRTTSLGVTTNTTMFVDASQGPEAYGQYLPRMFTAGMGGWDFLTHMGEFYCAFMPAVLFWGILLILPFLAFYIRQHTVIIPLTIFMFIGSILSNNMPPIISQLAFVFFALSATGIMYRLFIAKE